MPIKGRRQTPDHESNEQVSNGLQDAHAKGRFTEEPRARKPARGVLKQRRMERSVRRL